MLRQGIFQFSMARNWLRNARIRKEPLQAGQPAHNLHRFQADRDDAGDEVYDILRLIGTVRVVDDAAPFVHLDAILVYNPFQRRPVA